MVRVAAGDLTPIGIDPSFVAELPGRPPLGPLYASLDPSEPTTSSLPLYERLTQNSADFLESVQGLTSQEFHVAAELFVLTMGPVAIAHTRRIIRDPMQSGLYFHAKRAFDTNPEVYKKFLFSLPRDQTLLERALDPTAPFVGASRMSDERLMRAALEACRRLIEPTCFDYIKLVFALDDISNGEMEPKIGVQAGGRLIQELEGARKHLAPLIDECAATIRNSLSHDQPRLAFKPPRIIFSSKVARVELSIDQLLERLDWMYIRSTMIRGVLEVVAMNDGLMAIMDRLSPPE